MITRVLWFCGCGPRGAGFCDRPWRLFFLVPLRFLLSVSPTSLSVEAYAGCVPVSDSPSASIDF